MRSLGLHSFRRSTGCKPCRPTATYVHVGFDMKEVSRASCRQPGRLARVAVSEGFIAGLPKAELHVHHVGSVSQRVVAELAARHPGTVPSDPDELAKFFVFDDFPHFIRNYLAVVA